MTPIRAVKIVLFAAAASAAAMVVTASQGERTASLVIALAFSACAVVMSYLANQSFRNEVAHDGAGGGPAAASERCVRGLARANALLLAVVFLWGALVFLGVYGFTALWWWHSWQYGGAMFALAVALYVYARMVGGGTPLPGGLRLLDAAAGLSAGLAIGAAAGVGFLVASGKLSSVKPDWVANHIFLAGGIAVGVLALLGAWNHFQLRRMA